ncbi:MAG TPA: hypothetical protein PLM07_18215 [Candidatus Rifleibacterium sp.]|nr:hypothetical protein [Candidatus Rifleibacterium sp.]HPT47818.1 hypothetical protein [Candidatus Rifleibacterium sp.]
MRNPFIYLLLFLCLIVGGRADALSLEAQNAIESMRARLNAKVSAAEPVAQTQYIPGQQLAQALGRLRGTLYGIEPASIEVIAAAPVEAPAASDVYVVGDRLAAALVQIRHSQGRTESLQVAMASIDAPVKSPEPAVAEPATEEPTNPEVASAQPKSLPVPAEPVIQTAEPIVVASIKTAEPEKAPVIKKSSSAKKAKKKRAKKQTTPEPVLAKEPATSSVAKVAKDNNGKEDDKKFNEFIKKYDFKMPENYRIIVR